MEELRAMTLSLAVSLLAGSGADAEKAIEVAKKFADHIQGTGISINYGGPDHTPMPPPNLGDFLRGH